MKRLLRNIALIAVAVVGALSCTESGVEESIAPKSEGITIRAIAPGNDPSTKIEFTDKDAEGIALNWEVGDTFDLCEDGQTESLGVFECIDAENGEFISKNSELVLGQGINTYDAYYKSVSHHFLTDLAEQNGDEINNLDAACKMTARFTYDPDKDIEIIFAHTKAIMTFKFESAERPAKLIFENGDDIYTVTYSELAPVGTLYTSHIMIEPCAETERTLTFSLYDDEGTAYDVREVTTFTACVAGYRYTAPVSDLDPTVWLGSGTASDPYQITTAQQLRDLSTSVSLGTTYLGKYFVMTGDIDLGGIDADGNITEENEFTAIGSTAVRSFQGTFDGGGYEVSGLYINQPEGIRQGLFGYIDRATLKNLGVSGSVTGGDYTGGVVGLSATSSTVDNCYNRATIKGCGSHIGGVVGYAQQITVINSYNSAKVEGGDGDYVGGIVGYANNSTVINCYNTADVDGGDGDDVGGVVGYSESLVSGCYNKGSIKGSASIGGIVGCVNSSTVTNCYNTALVEGTSKIGGVVGENSSSVTNCYFDSDNHTGNAVGYKSSNGTNTNIVGYSTAYMQGVFFVALLNNSAYSYNESESATIKAYGWVAQSGGYPLLDSEVTPTYTEDFDSCTAIGSGTESDPYQIITAAHLRDLSTKVSEGEKYSGKYFAMTNDIDLGGIDDDGNITEENEFTAIGNSTTSFRGNFDGGGYEVSGLYINLPTNLTTSDYQGLFGYISGATIKNLGVSGSVTGHDNVGGIVGYFLYSSSITNCYNSASVEGANDVGGIAGYSYSSSSIANCYNRASVKGSRSVGGIAGYSHSSSIANCYTTGTVTGTSWVGDVVGNNSSNSTVTNCYYNSDNYSGNAVGYDNGGTVTNAVGYSTTIMQSGYLAALLNRAAYSYNESSPSVSAYGWVAVNGGYPALDSESAPTFADLCTAAGSGSESDPYLIIEGIQLRDLSDKVNNGGETYSGKYFKMTNDIDLGGEDNEFTAIGSSSSINFAGIFDGGGYKVSGLYINQPESTYQALFGYIYSATIKNLGISGSVIGYERVAGLVAYVNGTSTIENCYNAATVTSTSIGSSSGYNYTGGVVAITSSGGVRAINYCYNTGTITSGGNAGGVLGGSDLSRGSTVLSQCYNTGEIIGTAESGTCYIGGVVGHLAYTNLSKMDNCYNTGAVTGGSTDYVGGVAGDIYYTSMTNCYNAAAVAGGGYTGGVIGRLYGSDSSVASASYCYYNSDNQEYDAIGRFVNDYYTTTEVTSKSGSYMQSSDFVTLLNSQSSNTWTSDTGINGGYPILSWQ